MPLSSTNPSTDESGVRQELRAVLHAGRELPAQLDDSVIDAFMNRLDRHIDDRIMQHTSDARMPSVSNSSMPNAVAIIAVGIPWVVLAGVFGHDAGAILAVLVTGALAAGSMVTGRRR